MNMNAMMAQAKKMQAELEKKQQEIYKKEFLVEKQGVSVVLTKKKKEKFINVNKILVDPEDKEILEDLIIIAINEAIDLIEIELEKISPKLSGGF